MVKVIRRLAFLDALKEAFHKPTWDGIKHMWFKFRESNQVVAAYAPLGIMVYIPLITVILYGKTHSNPVARYFDYISIYRPDDPRAALIRKDSTLKYSMSTIFDTIHMPNTI
ncbi:uncharacterized protein [Bombus fervidus]|uniref:uncharacterized protein n=1 Tax=Bombus fervidus TaxID=203811 RepID=UPI003AB63D01